MKKTLYFLLLLALFSSTGFLSACGKIGPLYLPDSQPPAKQDK